jgi:hypothetical protein
VVDEPIYPDSLNTLEWAIVEGNYRAIPRLICAGANVNSVSYLRIIQYFLTYYGR